MLLGVDLWPWFKFLSSLGLRDWSSHRSCSIGGLVVTVASSSGKRWAAVQSDCSLVILASRSRKR